MPYITTKRVAEIRKELKSTFPTVKFSVRCKNYSAVEISILAAPILIDFVDESHYEWVNEYYIDRNYADQPELKNLLKQIYAIADKGNKTVNHDSDYGAIPSFYVNIKIGKWDKPYKYIDKT